MRESGSDWSVLIERIRASAARVREVEAQASERETLIEGILERVRADLGAAEERVRVAEAQTARAEAAAAERIRAAEARLAEAEARARTSEEWLKRIHETIFSEFAVIDEGRS
ncbi:hypothetical protein [Methylobacterium sp. J-076]|uniref:hypothetical protein n=1 Tax=Methylobacterium sp. J-076 TaxID=2836655 RepID=UPI001FBA17CC|nr:hypothetical protein [Methylobacterium sp. J-076]